MPNIPLSTTEIAKTHKIPKRTIIDHIEKGKLKAHKMPGLTGAYLIYPADLDQWLATPNRIMTEPYYADDHVTLYLGDCLEIGAWLSADVLVTDPPYGRNWRQGDLGLARNAASETGIANDRSIDVRDAALRQWNGPAIVFGDLMLQPPAGTKLTCVYQKTAECGLRGAIASVRRDAEAIYLIGKWPSGIGGRSSVFATRRHIAGAHGAVATFGGHPHTKPGDVMEQLVDLCPPGVIADPFAGSGSTLIAARNLGRRAIGVEIEERYCEIAAQRLNQMCINFDTPTPTQCSSAFLGNPCQQPADHPDPHSNRHSSGHTTTWQTNAADQQATA